MPLRDVTVRFATNEVQGDETYECWLKEGASAWALAGTGPVEYVGASQDFLLADLEEGTEYRGQFRMLRAGRYRSEYLSGNPDLWPAASRIVFTPGVTDFDAPALNSTAWSRTSGASQRVTVNATASAGNEARAIQLLRGGVVVDEVAGPHVGAVNLVDLDPPLAATHSYTVRHVDGFLVGTQSGAAAQWAGPAKPTGLVDATLSMWYSYIVNWDAPTAGAKTRVQDNYACSAVFVDRDAQPSAADATTFSTSGLEKESALEPNGNSPCAFDVRARHEVETFSVTDVSDWATVGVATEIASDETAFNSCL